MFKLEELIFKLNIIKIFLLIFFVVELEMKIKEKHKKILIQNYINIDKINLIQNESIVKNDKDDIEDNVSVIGLKIIEKEKEKLKDILILMLLLIIKLIEN